MENKTTVMVVDDEEDIRVVLRAFLEKEGYECIEAANGKEALQMAHSKVIDLILLDIMMPEMDGFQTLELLRQDKKMELIPVIMLTGVENKEKVKEALNKGVTYYINKPFETMELASKIRIALNEHLV